MVIQANYTNEIDYTKHILLTTAGQKIVIQVVNADGTIAEEQVYTLPTGKTLRATLALLGKEV